MRRRGAQGPVKALQVAALRACRRPAVERAARALERLDRESERVLSILTYHRVDELGARPWLDPSLVSARPAEFERQIAWLAADRQPISLHELLAVRRGQAALPDRAVLVTFDDGYADFAENAWPALRRHGVPAVLFVPTAFPGRHRADFWWDRLHRALRGTSRREAIQTPAGDLDLRSDGDRERAFRAVLAWVARTPHDEAMPELERLVLELGDFPPLHSILDWDELRALANEGLAVAPHSRTHPLLSRIPRERLGDEIAGSRDDIDRELGSCPPAFAAPGGACDDAVVRVLAEEGFDLAFAGGRGSNYLPRADWLRLHRMNVGRRSSVTAIRLQQLGFAVRAHAAMSRARA